MTIPKKSAIQGARAAARTLAGRDSALILDEWYVAAFSEEIGRSLLTRTLLNLPIVLFRSTAGMVIALDNRCPHRSYPLSSGRLDGDSIVCGYHGMRIDLQGDCIELPAVSLCPRGVGVKAYPIVERGQVCWIWLGDPQRADPGRIPRLEWLESDQWAGGKGYYHLKGSYVSLHENLLDTSHLSFLHAGTIGSPDYVKAPTKIEMGGGRFSLNRLVCPTRLPAALGQLTGFADRGDIARAVRNEFLSPALYEATTRLYDPLLDVATRREYTIRAAHMTTPETQTTTHYFIRVGRDFAQHDSASLTAMVSNLMTAFEEDVTALALQEQMQRAAGDSLYELSFASDELTVAMRRYLKSRIDAEQAPAPSSVTAQR
jgi:phenylpropionate dioxygenase-like ring-hydroxylating dioxygenase large terminal subunit